MAKAKKTTKRKTGIASANAAITKAKAAIKKGTKGATAQLNKAIQKKVDAKLAARPKCK